MHSNHNITFTFNHLADAFIQRAVQMRTIEAIRHKQHIPRFTLNGSFTVLLVRLVTVYCLLFVLKAQYNTALTMVYHSEYILNVVFVVKAE